MGHEHRPPGKNFLHPYTALWLLPRRPAPQLREFHTDSSALLLVWYPTNRAWEKPDGHIGQNSLQSFNLQVVLTKSQFVHFFLTQQIADISADVVGKSLGWIWIMWGNFGLGNKAWQAFLALQQLWLGHPWAKCLSVPVDWLGGDWLSYKIPEKWKCMWLNRLPPHATALWGR